MTRRIQIIIASVGLSVLVPIIDAQPVRAASVTTKKAGPKVELYSGAAKDDGGTKVKYFRSTEREQHFFAKLNKLERGVKVVWVFTAVKTAAGNNVKIAEAEASGLVANYVTGNLTLPRDFPIGTYRADLFVGGKLTSSLLYEVRSK
jgi:hypothetical protein